MKTSALLLLAMMTAPVCAEEHEPFPPITDEQREFAKAMVTVVAAGVVVPVATALLVGEVFDATCQAAGFEFLENPDYDGKGVHWYCTGVPRRE